jgi:hypothetical protein
MSRCTETQCVTRPLPSRIGVTTRSIQYSLPSRR